MVAGSRRCSLHAYQAGTAEQVPLWLRVVFSFPRYTIRSAYTVHAIFIVAFYNGLGASLGFISFFIAAGRSIDVVTDPLMGWITDAAVTRWGRRRPFLALGPPVYAAIWLLHVLPPSLEPGRPIALWFGITYLCFFLSDTAFSVPYYALSQELSTDQGVRNSVFFWQVSMSFVGLLVSVALPAALVSVTSQRTAYAATSFQMMAIYTVGMWGAVLGIRERVAPAANPVTRADGITTVLPGASAGADDDGDDVHKLRAESKEVDGKAPTATGGEKAAATVPQAPSAAPFVANLTRVLSTSAFRLLAASYCLDYAALMLIGAVGPFFVQYHVIEPSGTPQDAAEATRVVGGAFALSMVGAILSGPGWMYLTKKKGKRFAWLACTDPPSLALPARVLRGHAPLSNAVAFSPPSPPPRARARQPVQWRDQRLAPGRPAGPRRALLRPLRGERHGLRRPVPH